MMKQALLGLLCLFIFFGQVGAGQEREPRYLRLYMTDMHGWGEIREMNMVIGDSLFISAIIEDLAGNPVIGQRIRIQSRLGNRISTENGYSDEDGWIHADILATTPGEDVVLFQAGEISSQLKLMIVGDPDDLPASQGQLGSTQPLVVDYPGALPWEVFADVTPDKNFGPPSYGVKISAYDGKEVILQGFMLPLENAERQSHFILSANPPHCYFCMPGGAESLVEILAGPPITFSYDPIVLQGTLQLIRDDDAMGLYYRLRGARIINQ